LSDQGIFFGSGSKGWRRDSPPFCLGGVVSIQMRKVRNVNRKWLAGKSLLLILFFSTSLIAQTGSPPVSSVFAELTSSLESRSATAGQEVILRTISDVVVDNEIVIPKGSKMLGHITQVIAKRNNDSRSVLAIVIEKAIRKDGTE